MKSTAAVYQDRLGTKRMGKFSKKTLFSLVYQGHDATDLSLSAAQVQLASAVAAAAAPKPVVVVIMSAVPLDLSPLMADKNIGAILYVGCVLRNNNDNNTPPASCLFPVPCIDMRVCPEPVLAIDQ